MWQNLFILHASKQQQQQQKDPLVQQRPVCDPVVVSSALPGPDGFGQGAAGAAAGRGGQPAACQGHGLLVLQRGLAQQRGRGGRGRGQRRQRGRQRHTAHHVSVTHTHTHRLGLIPNRLPGVLG